MTFPANGRSGSVSVHDDVDDANRSAVVIRDGASVRRGYTHEKNWSDHALRGTMTSPPILFQGETVPETVDLRSARTFFVRSLQADDHAEPIHFHNNMPHAELLWVRLVLHDGEEFEGMMPNSERLMLDDVLALTPTDPQTNNRKIFFPKSQVQNFHVLGVRSA